MHIENEYDIMDLIMSVGILTLTKMKDGSNDYCVMFYDKYVEYDKDLGQALKRLLQTLNEKNYFTNEEQKEEVEYLLNLS